MNINYLLTALTNQLQYLTDNRNDRNKKILVQKDLTVKITYGRNKYFKKKKNIYIYINYQFLSTLIRCHESPDNH